MGEGRSIWVGKDEHHGVLAQPRKDLRPPPHWRLEAIAATPMPRTLTIGADRRHAVFIEDRDTSDVFLLDLESGSVPERLTTGRDPMPWWDDSPPQPVARRRHRRLHGRRPCLAGAHRRAALRASWSRAEARAGSTTARLVISVERDDATTSRLAVVDVDDPWPRRLAVSHGELDAHGDEGEAAPSPDGTEVAYTFTPRADQSRSSEIRVATVDGGAVRRLTGEPDMHDGGPEWSPDGQTIAYASERSGFYELHLVGRDGEGDRQLTSAGADHPAHDWHPDGTRLVAVEGPSEPLRPRLGERRRRQRRGAGARRHAGTRRAGPRPATSSSSTRTTRRRARSAGSCPARTPRSRSTRRRPKAIRSRAARRARGRHLRVVRRPRDPRLPDASRGTRRRTIRFPPWSTRTAGRPTTTATTGTGTRSTSSTRATPGSRSTSAGPPATAASSSARTTATGEWATRRTAWPRRTSCARSTGSTASGSASSAPATARTWRCSR